MTNDDANLVQRLRWRFRETSWDEYREAADRIDTLTAQLAASCKFVEEMGKDIDSLTAENAALRRTNDTLHKDWSEVNAENERLRAALRKIDQCWQESGAGCCDCAHVARTALSQHTQSGGGE